MREGKETGVHGTLLMSQDVWKFNSKQLLSKTLNSRMNIIETRADLNIVNSDEIWITQSGAMVFILNLDKFLLTKLFPAMII